MSFLTFQHGVISQSLGSSLSADGLRHLTSVEPQLRIVDTTESVSSDFFISIKQKKFEQFLGLQMCTDWKRFRVQEGGSNRRISRWKKSGNCRLRAQSARGKNEISAILYFSFSSKSSIKMTKNNFRVCRSFKNGSLENSYWLPYRLGDERRNKGYTPTS